MLHHWILDGWSVVFARHVRRGDCRSIETANAILHVCPWHVCRSSCRTASWQRTWGIYEAVGWSLDDREPYNDPAVAAVRDKATDLGLGLRLTRLGTRGQLAFAVPVDGLDFWRASLHAEGKRGVVAYELRNTALQAAQAVLAAYEKSRPDDPKASG